MYQECPTCAFAQAQVYHNRQFLATAWAKAAQAGRLLPPLKLLGFRA